MFQFFLFLKRYVLRGKNSMMVSVVIPTFQRNDFLERAINSVFKQNFTDYEILIIDDNVGENVYRINNRNLEI
ncbi:glycosyltransferase [Enterococcus lactis]|uniref:glycosyltransferase n=2 Tax=Enterococcus TaxID=1350 RepID=UPI002FD84772